ncbi:MAG TPA: leucine-rich repeat domain-containing protein [Verrucomicrobiales bacterium]|nr:leucine-rich repeat domain-containing protein [Verrucomicrobiales bacterium]
MLHLQGGKWKSLEGLEKLSEKLTQLKELNLESNKLTEVKGLRKLSQLEKLELQYNKLTNLEGLDQLTQLKELWLRGNPDLTFVQIDKLQKALPKCIIFS